jgi:hypothetical protein
MGLCRYVSLLQMSWTSSVGSLHCLICMVSPVVFSMVVVTTLAQNNHEEVILIRRCPEPNQPVRKLYDALKYKYAPFVKRKIRSTQIRTRNCQSIDKQEFHSDELQNGGNLKMGEWCDFVVLTFQKQSGILNGNRQDLSVLCGLNDFTG